MATLNTAIRGVQIQDGTVTLDKIFSGSSAQLIVVGAGGVPAYQDVTGDVTISDAGVTAIGATKVTDAMINDDVATALAGDGLSATTGVMALDLNELTGAAIDVANDSIAIIDANDSDTSRKEAWADVATAIAGSGITATAGVLSADAVADMVADADIQMENESANCDGSTTAFTLSSLPLEMSVQVYLNGLLQESGSGKDYLWDTTTITFATAPISGDILIVHYIIND